MPSYTQGWKGLFVSTLHTHSFIPSLPWHSLQTLLPMTPRNGGSAYSNCCVCLSAAAADLDTAAAAIAGDTGICLFMPLLLFQLQLLVELLRV